MKACMDQIGTTVSLRNNLDILMREQPETKTILLLAAEKNSISDQQYCEIFKSYPVKILGGIFPKVLYSDLILEQGHVIVGLEYEMKHYLIEGLNDIDTDLEKSLSSAVAHLHPARSLLLLMDGFSRRIGDLLSSIYDHFGADYTYVGGGAGRTSMTQTPCIFADNAVHEGKALLIGSYRNINVTVEHGYQVFSGPYIATKSQDNVIDKIDYTEPYDFYSKILKEKCNFDINFQELGKYSKRFPIGIEKFDGTIIVRDPLFSNGKNIRCIGQIPEDSVIHILEGVEQNLIKAAEAGTKKMKSKAPNYDIYLIIDCYNRLSYLGQEHYSECLKSINKNAPECSLPIIGVFSLGEIASDGTRALEFYSKTIVQCGWKQAS